MKFSKLVAFLMAVLLCVGAVAVSFAANSELTEKQSEKLYSIAYKALRGEGYKVNTYDECTAESVNNIRWITFLKGGKMKWRCDVTHKGNVNYLVNYDFYQKETTIKDAKTAKKSEIRKAMTKPTINPTELAAISVAGTFVSDPSTFFINFSPRLRKTRINNQK